MQANPAIAEAVATIFGTFFPAKRVVFQWSTSGIEYDRARSVEAVCTNDM